MYLVCAFEVFTFLTVIVDLFQEFAYLHKQTVRNIFLFLVLPVFFNSYLFGGFEIRPVCNILRIPRYK